MADSFAKRLQVARIAKNFRTMRDFARSLGINENTYARYERGQSHPSPATLDRICRHLGVSIDALTPVSRDGLAVPHMAYGFAEEPAAESLGRPGIDVAAQEAVSSGRHRLSARIWRLAAVLARARGFPSTDVKAIAGIFQTLREDPVTKLAAMVADIDDAAWTPKLGAELQAAIAAVVQHFDDNDSGGHRD